MLSLFLQSYHAQLLHRLATEHQQLYIFHFIIYALVTTIKKRSSQYIKNKTSEHLLLAITCILMLIYVA